MAGGRGPHENLPARRRGDNEILKIHHTIINSSTVYCMSSNKEQPHVHYLPCSIKFNGPAPVQSYLQIALNPTTQEMTTAFRGRELKGKDVSVPSGVKAVWMRKGQGSRLDIVNGFDKFIMWDHDIQPDPEMFEEYFDWFKIGKSVSISMALFMLH